MGSELNDIFKIARVWSELPAWCSVTTMFLFQIVFLLIAQYTVLSEIEPVVGNWVEIVGNLKIFFFALFNWI